MKWEYRTLKLPVEGFFNKTIDEVGLEHEMNQFGQDGWELVSVLGANIGFGETNEVLAIFKRAQ